MNDLKIIVSVDTEEGKRSIEINRYDIEMLAEKAAKKNGWKAKQGRMIAWFSPSIISVALGDL